MRRFVLAPASNELLLLERQHATHSPFARNVRAFLAGVNRDFDVCIVDMNPNPDIRVNAELVSAHSDYDELGNLTDLPLRLRAKLPQST